MSENKLARIMEWHITLSGAKRNARFRDLPIVQVEQPKGQKPLYGFYGTHYKRYYIVTSAPKTVVDAFRSRGIKAKIIGKVKTLRGRKSARFSF